MAVWANQLQIFKIIVISVSVFVMNLQNFIFAITTAFTTSSFTFQKSYFKRFVVFYFIIWAENFVLNSSPLNI